MYSVWKLWIYFFLYEIGDVQQRWLSWFSPKSNLWQISFSKGNEISPQLLRHLINESQVWVPVGDNLIGKRGGIATTLAAVSEEQEGGVQVIAGPGFVGNLCSPASATFRGPCLQWTWGQSHSARGLFGRQTRRGFGIECNLLDPPETSAEMDSPSEPRRSVQSEPKSPILLAVC